MWPFRIPLKRDRVARRECHPVTEQAQWPSLIKRRVGGGSALGVGVFAGGSKGRASFAIRLFVCAAEVRVGRTLVLSSLDNCVNWQARARRRCELWLTDC